MHSKLQPRLACRCHGGHVRGSQFQRGMLRELQTNSAARLLWTLGVWVPKPSENRFSQGEQLPGYGVLAGGSSLNTKHEAALYPPHCSKKDRCSGSQSPMTATVEGSHTCLEKDGRVSRVMLEFSLSALTIRK